VLAVLQGEVLFALPSPPPVIAQSGTGTIRILATTAPARLPAFPDVPTMAEAGVGGVTVVDWSGLWAPARTPPGVIATLNKAVRQVLASPELKQKTDKLSLTIEGSTVEAVQQKMAADLMLWKTVAEKAHISMTL
jgi:tripartite-type tricarboxylate transporter receptor subunit TctC